MYKFLVMLFGLANALTTYNLVYDIVSSHIDRFVVVYLDDYIYSKSFEDRLSPIDSICLGRGWANFIGA